MSESSKRESSKREALAPILTRSDCKALLKHSKLLCDDGKSLLLKSIEEHRFSLALEVETLERDLIEGELSLRELSLTEARTVARFHKHCSNDLKDLAFARIRHEIGEKNAVLFDFEATLSKATKQE